MCIAVPGEIISICNREAMVNVMGIETTVNVHLINEPKVGEYVLIHAGCAIEKMNQDYYDDLTHIFREVLDNDERRDE